MASVSLLMVPYWLSEDLRRKKLKVHGIVCSAHEIPCQGQGFLIMYKFRVLIFVGLFLACISVQSVLYYYY